MASLCSRCALRLRHVAASDTPSTVRSFSSTTTRSAHAIPKFTETSNEELDDVLASMRNKHFVPAALTPAQRRLIFGDKNREEMTKHPRTIEIAGEPIELKWMDRRKEIPNRTKLFRSAIRLMTEDGSREAWGNLLQILVGLKRSGVEITDIEVTRILRAALQTGHFGAILSCLRRGDETGITLQRPEVLDAILLGLRRHAQKDEWGQENIDRAIKEGRDVAQLLESEMHGGGKVMRENDLRRDPRVIGVFLELSAMFAARHQDGKDVDGRVRAYSERLLANLEGSKEVSVLQFTPSVTLLTTANSSPLLSLQRRDHRATSFSAYPSAMASSWRRRFWVLTCPTQCWLRKSRSTMSAAWPR